MSPVAESWVAKQEELFLSRYDWLRTKALHLTKFDAELAEDLVHDVYVQLTLTKLDLDRIEKIDAYLFVMLRNMHLSLLRRRSRTPFGALSVIDFDSAEIGLKSPHPVIRMQSRDELLRICQYAAVRMETSRAGGVFLLRYLYSFYPVEIAAILRNPRRAADDWLRIARREIRDYISSGIIPKTVAAESLTPPSLASGLNSLEFLRALRELVRRTRKGACLAQEGLRALYAQEGNSELGLEEFAHLVSCPRCLDAVSGLLGIPGLAERFGDEPSGRGGREDAAEVREWRREP